MRRWGPGALSEEVGRRGLVEQGDPFTQRVAFPVVDGLVRALMAVLPTALIGRARVWLVTAGGRVSLAQFLSMALMSAAGSAVVTFAAVTVIARGSSATPLVVTLPVFSFIGLMLPFALLRRAATARDCGCSATPIRRRRARSA